MKKKITIVDKDLNQLVVVADCSSALYQDRGTKLGEQNLLSQVRNFPCVSNGVEHSYFTSAFPPASSIFCLADAEKAAGELRGFHGELLGQLAVTKNFYAVKCFFQKTSGKNCVGIYNRAVLKAI